MRILAHVHTLNDEHVIEHSLRAIQNQQRRVDAILIVDNGSTDATLDRTFPENVSIIRHGENLGTSGSVRAGMSFALDKGFDWIWIFDADSAPRPEALRRLLEFYSRLPREKQNRVHRLASLPVDVVNHHECHGMLLTPSGMKNAKAPPDSEPYECVGTHWTGSLFRTDAIRQVGLPPFDYVLDWGDHEYGYRAMVGGWLTYIVPCSILDHNIDKSPTFDIYTKVRFGPIAFSVRDLPPIRLYYIIRNEIFFWLHEYHDRSVSLTLRLLPSWAWIPKHLIKFALLGRWKELTASLRAIRDGLFAHMERRY